MDNYKGQTIFLSVIGIATLLVAILGATFAWFSVAIQGSDKPEEVIVTSATLSTVVFNDGDQIKLENIMPGISLYDNFTKTFTISNRTANSSEEINYVIYLDVTENSLTTFADGYFAHSLTASASNNGVVVTPINDEVVPGVGKNKLGTGTLKGSETHTYTYSIHLKDTNGSQNIMHNNSFTGKLIVESSIAQD